MGHQDEKIYVESFNGLTSSVDYRNIKVWSNLIHGDMSYNSRSDRTPREVTGLSKNIGKQLIV